MRTTMRTIVVTVTALLCFSCVNNSNSGDVVLNDSIAKQTPSKTWDDYQRTKDSLWIVFNESTDDADSKNTKITLLLLFLH